MLFLLLARRSVGTTAVILEIFEVGLPQLIETYETCHRRFCSEAQTKSRENTFGHWRTWIQSIPEISWHRSFWNMSRWEVCTCCRAGGETCAATQFYVTVLFGTKTSGFSYVTVKFILVPHVSQMSLVWQFEFQLQNCVKPIEFQLWWIILFCSKTSSHQRSGRWGTRNNGCLKIKHPSNMNLWLSLNHHKMFIWGPSQQNLELSLHSFYTINRVVGPLDDG